MKKVLLIGSGAREDCIAEALKRSSHQVQLHTISEVNNPGLLEKSETLKLIDRIDNVETVQQFARQIQPDFAIIGPESPLAAGVVDILQDRLGIPCVGPLELPALLETSKSFMRDLLGKYGIPFNPKYGVFYNPHEIEPYLQKLKEFVIKPDGLTSGKGVKVYGEDLDSIEEALMYCWNLFENGHKAVLVEEKLDGEEFSLQSFCDGKHIVDMPAVQDHKRAFEGDTGPNTGGMGSYSCSHHNLPFLYPEHLRQASAINAAVAEALRNDVGEYKGILYGSFMLTSDGLKVIEYNARFGDPEAMNVLPLLKTDFLDICEAIINGTLDQISVEFREQATVCKYIVPQGYPIEYVVGGRCINMDFVPKPSDELRIYYGMVDRSPANNLFLTGSRTVAFVGLASYVNDAEQIAEDAASRVTGPVYHRKDIGTRPLIQKRLDHVRKIMKEK